MTQRQRYIYVRDLERIANEGFWKQILYVRVRWYIGKRWCGICRLCSRITLLQGC